MKKAAIMGIIILISTSTLFRGLYFSFEKYGFMSALALLASLYLIIKIAQKEPIRINSLYISLGILLITAVLLSFARAVNPRQNLEHLLLYSELLILFIVLYDYFYEGKQKLIEYMMALTVIVGFAGAVVGLMSLTQRFSIWQVFAENNRVGSTFQYANTASVYFLICIIFSITIVNASKSILVKAFVIGVGNTILFAFFMTGSRGGYLVAVLIFLLLLFQPKGYRIRGWITFTCMAVPGFIVMRNFNASTAAHDNFRTAKWIAFSFAISAISWLAFYSLKKLITRDMKITILKQSGLVFSVVSLAALILVIVFRDRVISVIPAFIVSRVTSLFKSGFQEKNVLYRLIFNKDALKLIADNWLLGLGAGGWKAMYQSVQDFFYTAKAVHNHYLQIFVENGILGFLSFTALALLSAVGASFSWLRARSGQLKVKSAGLLCGFAALAAHAAFDFDLTYVSLMLLFWVMFAASAVGLPNAKDVRGEKTDMDSGITSGVMSESCKAGTVRYRLLLIDRFRARVSGSTAKMVFVIGSAALFSIHGLYFAGAYKGQIAFDYMQEGNIKQARIFYEEANRLDPANTNYSFELANIYYAYSKNTSNDEYRKDWLDKARIACERSVDGNRNYPAYMNILVRIYLDSDMPLEALDLSQKLVQCQKYNAGCYKLLAASYLAAAEYYEKNTDVAMAQMMLEECLEIDINPHLHRSGINQPKDRNCKEIIAAYEHSEELAGYLSEAENTLKRLN